MAERTVPICVSGIVYFFSLAGSVLMQNITRTDAVKTDAVWCWHSFCPSFVASSHRGLSSESELIDSHGLCVFQLLDILHLFVVAPELLSDQDLHTTVQNSQLILLLF